MSVEDAIAAARAGRVALLVDAEIAAGEVVRVAGDGAMAVLAHELVLGAPAVEPGVPLLVVDGAAAVAGLVDDLWCGPWTLATFVGQRQPGAVVVLDRHGHPGIEAILARHLELERVGALAAGEEPAPAGSTSPDAVAGALAQAREQPLGARSPDEAGLLFDLALTGALDEVWRVPFLVHVADHGRFKPPHVDEDEQIRCFHEDYDRFVSTLGMLEAAEYQLNGRQPRDLRQLADAVGTPVHELVWIFRRMDHRRVVVSKPMEEGLGERPNLEIVVGSGSAVDPRAAADAVSSLRALRNTLAATSPAVRRLEAQPAAPNSAGDALVVSLKDSPSLVDAPTGAAPPTPRPTRPARSVPPAEELPTHLPGLAELAAGDLRGARARLVEVEGQLRPEALLLATFRYQFLDAAGGVHRRYQIPEPVRDIGIRALELVLVPAVRVRETMDREFPDAFVEIPGPGEIEVFFDDGPLSGTHRFRELSGRARFEAPLLEGRRAAQNALIAGEAVELEAGDVGWDTLAEALRLRDGDRAEEALAALEEVDLDLDLASIRRTIVRVLPEEHPERIELQRREAEEQERRALGVVLDGIERTLHEGRSGEHDGFQSLERAAEIGVLDRLADFLRRRSDDDPRDLGPALWLGRVEARRGEFSRSQDAYRRAARILGGRSRTVEWRFELVESALRGGGVDVAWDTISELVADGASPRDVDQQLDRLFRSGVLSHQHHGAILELFGASKLRRLPRTSRRLQRQDTMEPWKKALQALQVDE